MRKTLVLCLLLCLSTTLVAASTLTVTPLAPITDAESDGSIGTSYSFYGTSPVRGSLLQDYAPYGNAAGSRYDRIDFSWDRIETSPEAYDFSGHDEIVDHDTASSLNMIGILMSTADWASANCPATASDLNLSPTDLTHLQTFGDQVSLQSATALPWCPYPPDGLYLPWNDPLNHWGDFVYDTVRHYNLPGNPQVDVWEVWNEPDWSLFWRGSKADYAQLLKVAYQATKAANPDATVLFGGLFYWIDTNWYKDVMNILPTVQGATENNHYFDVLSLHQYSNIYNIRPTVAAIDAHMASTVGDHPVWITETGVPLCEEPGFDGLPCDAGSFRARAEEAGYYAIQAYTEARAVGVEKFIWFRMHDEYMGEAFGLMRNDYTFRPAYPALQVAARYLHGENQITGPLGDANTRRFSYWGTPNGLIDVLWNTGTETITTTRPAYLPTATLIDHRGITQTLTAVNDTYTLTLSGATTHTGNNGETIIGGPPLLLIQEDTVPPTSSMDTLPSTIYSDTIPLSWNAEDDAAGYWYGQIERARDSAGPWTEVAGWGKTNSVTSTAVTIAADGLWYLRMRARDRVGNWEDLPATAEISTTLITTRTVDLMVSTYIDTNGNGRHDVGEIMPAEAVDITWRYADGTPIASTSALLWHYNTTLRYGATVITAQLPGYLITYHPTFVATGPDQLQIILDLGLREITNQVFLPTVRR